MPSHKLIDSHVHLWPASAANTGVHAWMGAVPSLAKQHSVAEYLQAASQIASLDEVSAEESEAPHLLGYVYVETDRVLTAECPWNESEMRWLEELCESSADGTNGHGPGDESFLKGIVLWAPFDQDAADFERYLDFVRRKTPGVWKKLSGFRYLLQGITDEADFRNLVGSESFLSNLRACGTAWRRFTFDVGIDHRSGGIWQLEAFAEVIERLNGTTSGEEAVNFVLNHFCKPDISDSKFDEWRRSVQRLSRNPNVFMKLSGLFSEMPQQDGADGSNDVLRIAKQVEPWFREVLNSFTSQRCMWGSDWPVCNVNGPSEESTWEKWYTVVDTALDRCGLDRNEKDDVWWRTANKLYNLGITE